MRKIKDFLMMFGLLCIIISVSFGFGILLGKVLHYVTKFFPDNFQLPIAIGMFFVCIGLLTSVLINLKKKDE